MNCCGGSSFVPIAPEKDCLAAIGTNVPIEGVTLNPILFHGTVDASTVITGTRPWFSPLVDPAACYLTRLSVAEENTFPGFARGCFPPGLAELGNDDVMNPMNWWRFIEVIAESYESWKYAAARAQYHWPKLEQGAFVENTESVIPGTWAAVSDDTLYFFSSGSSNYQQLALQAAASFTGPQPCGLIKTSPFWCNSYNHLWVRLMGYGLPERPKVICAGHSYGGVMASLMAWAIKQANPDKDVSLITYGCPCPGDQALSDALWNIRAVHMVNRGDPVASIPPGGRQLPLVGWILDNVQVLAWQKFFPLHNRYSVLDDGSYHFVHAMDADLAVLQVLTEQLRDGDIPEPFAAHDQWEYTRRLRLTAGLPPE